MLPTARSFVSVCSLAALASVASAQDSSAEPAEIETASPITISFSANQSFLFDTDLRGGTTGDVFTSRTGFGLSLAGKVNEELSLSLGLSGTFSQYDFSGTADPFLTGPDALDDAYELGIRLTGRRTIDETWSVLAGVFTRAGAADGADLDDAFTFGGLLAAGYKASDNFSIDFGLLASTRLEDDALIVPYLALKWKIDESLTLETTGLGAKLTAAIDDEWSVFLQGRYDAHEFRLDDGFAPNPGGVVRDESFPVGVGVQFAPRKGFRVSLEGGVVIEREFEFFDTSENDIRTIETDSGAYLGIRVAITF